MDVKLPGMLNAAIKESPVFGGKVKSFDAAKVAGMPGVKKVVQVGDAARRGRRRYLVAGQDRARGAADRLGRGPNAKVSSASIADMLKAGLDAPDAFVGNQHGDAKAAIAKAAKKVEAVYAYPFQNHAAMEPMNATALYTADKCEVWIQHAERRSRASRRPRRRPDCRSKMRRAQDPSSAAASAGGAFQRLRHPRGPIAKEMPGTPIKLIKSREDDTAHGVYHPITQCKLTGALDANNNLTGLHMRISGQSILAAVHPEGSRTGAIRSRSRACTQAAPKPRSATPSRTC